MAESNVGLAASKLQEELKRLEEAIQANQAAQVKYGANLNHEREQEAILRKEKAAVAEALKHLGLIR